MGILFTPCQPVCTDVESSLFKYNSSRGSSGTESSEENFGTASPDNKKKLSLNCIIKISRFRIACQQALVRCGRSKFARDQSASEASRWGVWYGASPTRFACQRLCSHYRWQPARRLDSEGKVRHVWHFYQWCTHWSSANSQSHWLSSHLPRNDKVHRLIDGETLSAYSAHPRKIPGRMMLIPESCSVNKRLIVINKQICLYSFLNFTFGFLAFHLKKLKNMNFDLARGRKFSCKQ